MYHHRQTHKCWQSSADLPGLLRFHSYSVLNTWDNFSNFVERSASSTRRDFSTAEWKIDAPGCWWRTRRRAVLGHYCSNVPREKKASVNELEVGVDRVVSMANDDASVLVSTSSWSSTAWKHRERRFPIEFSLSFDARECCLGFRDARPTDSDERHSVSVVDRAVARQCDEHVDRDSEVERQKCSHRSADSFGDCSLERRDVARNN